MKVIEYEWRLREVMAVAGMYKTTALIAALEERGVSMSSSQVYRLVTEVPERLNLRALVALMDILGCGADDLIRPVPLGAVVERTGTESTKGESAGEVLRGSGARPRRALITPGDTDR
ncbi:MAG: XRE family transcriptional regulator [Actinobacteria bacterium HGW-Actinobacteria-11]|nr:MAG: XRE family transcriptional regulator [Actinobacteria bacterium HGW-Actinobacteria-11]